MKIKCIAIDDEPPALMQMENYINKTPFLELLASFDNGLEPLSFLKSNKVDLIFLDIQMDDFTGIQFLKTLTQRPKVILTTAFDNYALKAFDLDVTDYLLKPISFERFLHAVEKVYDYFSLQNTTVQDKKNETTAPRDYIFVKTEYRMQRVDFKNILFIEGMKEYLQIVTSDDKIMVLQNFRKMEEMLPKDNFVRVHRSFIVALDKIDSIERNRIYIGDKIIPVSESYKPNFQNMIEGEGLV